MTYKANHWSTKQCNKFPLTLPATDAVVIAATTENQVFDC